MQTRVGVLLGAVDHEWRRLRRAPVWMIGLLAMIALAVSEAGTSPILGYPSDTRCLYGFQLACSMLLGLVTFLLVSGSVAADLDSSRKDLILSRPAPGWVYLAGKFVGGVTFSLALALVVMLLCAASPLWHGHPRVHGLGPFLTVLGVCTVPMVCYVAALALVLTTVFRAVVITLPIMVLYFFGAVLLNSRSSGSLSLVDFSQRLYPRELLVEVPMRLSECTFAGLIAPLSGMLVMRSLLYGGLALALFVAAVWALRRNLDMRFRGGVQRLLAAAGSRTALSARAGESSSARDGLKGAAPARRSERQAPRQPGSRQSALPALLTDEARLFIYTVKLMAGRNLVAVSLICLALILIVLNYQVGPYQTRAGVLVFNLEMFAPLLGIVMFSDLVAGEFECRRADLLRASGRGAAWLLVRRVVHAALLTGVACLLVLVMIRVVYTRFELSLALAAALPGAMFFGTLGLFAAALSKRSLTGYAAGTGALILTLNLEQVQPLTPVSLQLRDHLANSRLLGEANWLVAKAGFVLLALALVIAVTRLAKRPSKWKPVLAGSTVLLAGTFVSARLLWSEPSNPGFNSTASFRQLSSVETNGVRLVRSADTDGVTRRPGRLPTTRLLDVRSVEKAGGWQRERETPVDLTLEFSLRHVDLDLSVQPATAAIDAEALFTLKILAGSTGRLLFYLGSELEIHQLLVNERRAQFKQTGDLVDVTLAAPVLSGDELTLRVHYSGRLRLPQNLRFEHASSDALFVTTRFYPSLRPSDSNSRNLFTCRVTVRTPLEYRVAAAEFVREERGENLFVWESRTPVDNIPLFVGTFREYRGQYGSIPISFCSFSTDAGYAKTALLTAAAALREFEAAFGAYPFPRLAIVEHRFQSAGGAAFPGLITIKPDRLAPEHQQRFLDGYLPHEIAHCWWGDAFPRWIAEGGAVFSSGLFLERQRSPRVARDFFEQEFRQPFLSPRNTLDPLVTSSGSTAYTKGGYFFSMLRLVAGEAAVLEAMKTFLATHADAQRYDPELCTVRMTEQLRDATPAEWHPFLHAWTHGIERLDPELTGLSQSTDGTVYDVRIDLTHRGKLRFPIPVRVTFKSGSVTNLCWSSTNETGTIHLRSPEPVLAVEMDPDLRLLDWDRSNNRLAAGEVRVQGKPDADRFVGWKTFTETDGLPGADIRCFAFSPGGRLFAGVSSYSAAVNRRWAIAQYDGEWRPYDPKAEPVPFVSTMAWAGPSFWLASQNHLRRMIGDDSLEWMTSRIPRGGYFGERRFAPNPAGNPGLPGFRIHSLLADSAGRVWIGTDEGLAVCEATNGAAGAFSSIAPLAGAEVVALASPVLSQSSSPLVYAATSRGLYLLTGTEWRRVPSVPPGIILSLATTPGGALWCGTFRSGLISVAESGVRSYSYRNSPLPDTIFSCLAAGAAGSIWCGTPDGLIRFDGREWVHFTRDNSGLPSHRIHCLACDPAGRVWIGTDVGVTLFDPSFTRSSAPASRSTSPTGGRYPES